jgi:hypothetical protein
LKCGSFLKRKATANKGDDFHDFNEHVNAKIVYDNGSKLLYLSEVQPYLSEALSEGAHNP